MTNTSHPNRGLPLARPRSGVYSQRRERTELRVQTTTPQLAAAVAVVLFRYHGHLPVPLGVGSSVPELVEVHIDPGEPAGELRNRMAVALRALRGIAPPAEGNRNSEFDVAVLDAAPQSDWREDVVAWSTPAGVEALWRTRLFDRSTVERFLGHVHAVLKATDGQRIDDIDLLSPEEQTLLQGFESGASAGGTAPVQVQVLQQARRTPGRPALETGSGIISYAELERRSAVIARALITRGARAGDAVGVCVSAAEGVPALLGILRTGAVAVPLDPTLPRARLRSHIDQANIRRAVVDDARRELVPMEELIVLDEIDAGAISESINPDAPVTDESAAYILYTSGSTGTPKGIRMPHRALSNVIAWQMARSAPAPRTLHRTSLAFDVGMQEIFSTLCAGGCLVVADEETRSDPSRLPDFIAAHRIERAFLPPVSLYQIAATLDAHPQPLPSLREVHVAGEALRIDPPVVRFFRGVDAILENQYGPTETHVVTTFRPDDSPLRWPARPPIGKPVPGVEVRIVDAHGRRVPRGIAGEIVVRGRQVAHGYLDGTSFVAEDGTPQYATGDLGRWTSAGDIEFLGRKDRQIKVRGYRIEPAEIESALQAQAGVQSAVVGAIGDGSPRLVAWIVPDAAFPGVSAIRKRLLDVLPEYMVPGLSGFAVIDQLPLTRTGKVDLAALKPPGHDPDSGSHDAPSRNQVESIVAEIWRRELGLERIGIHDDFVEIGGHSLVAIRIVSRLNERFGVSLPLRLLLRGGTIATVAARLVDATTVEPPQNGLVRCPLPDGRIVVAPSAGEVQYLWQDVFTHESYGHPIVYDRESVIVDVGAHVGLYTLYALAAAPEGRVVAIEPVPVLFEALKQNTATHLNRVTYYAAAAGDHDGSASITYYPKLSGMSSLRASPTGDASLLRTIMRNLLEHRPEAGTLLEELDEIVTERLVSLSFDCRVRRLEGILDEAAPDRIDILKIDVQRYEEPVLHGVGSAWRRVKQVIIEVHDEDGALGRMDGFLQERGFRTSTKHLPIHAGTPVHFLVGAK